MRSLIEVIAVFVGGALGALSRFLLSRSINELLPKNYPWGVWFVNIIGCLIIGVVAALFMHKYVHSTFIRAFIVVGVLGGFTTFSSFSLDTFTLLQNGEIAKAFTYLFSSVIISVAATAASFIAIRAVIS